MKELDASDLHVLNAAQGWLELSDIESAEQELNQLSPEGRAHPLFLFIRWELYARTEQWSPALILSQYLVALCPDEPTAWLQRSYSLHALHRSEEAFQQLLPAAQKFTKLYTIPYHLAGYACQAGYVQEAWHWLDKAIEAGNPDEVKSMALEDPVMAPLWHYAAGCLTPSHQEA